MKYSIECYRYILLIVLITLGAGTGYGEQVIFKTRTGNVADVNGNVYYTVTINDRIWMAENLRTTIYADGSPITLSESQSSWFASRDAPLAYFWCNNDINNKAFGLLSLCCIGESCL